jgi:hypothetical protein
MTTATAQPIVKSLGGDVRFDTGILLCGRVKRDLNKIGRPN